MNQNKQALMKIFSLVLRDRAKAEMHYKSISPELVKFFTRKELIEMITQKYKGEVPEQYNLMELENEGLLGLIGDDFYIISYLSEKWSEQAELLPVKPKDLPVVKPEKKHPIAAGNKNQQSQEKSQNQDKNKKEDSKESEKKS